MRRTLNIEEDVDEYASDWRLLLEGVAVRHGCRVGFPIEVASELGCCTVIVDVVFPDELDDETSKSLGEDIKSEMHDVLRRFKRLKAVAALQDFEQAERALAEADNAATKALEAARQVKEGATDVADMVGTVKKLGAAVQAVVAALRLAGMVG